MEIRACSTKRGRITSTEKFNINQLRNTLMIDFNLQRKLLRVLSLHNIKYNFLIEDIFLYSEPHTYQKYVSYALESIVEIINDSILDNDFDNPSYDIDLINKITKCLLDTNDEELINIAWNSFIACSNDERFILHKKMKESDEIYFNQLIRGYNTNHTKVFETERLIIKPNNKEDGQRIFNYINKYDEKEYLLARMVRNNNNDNYFTFNLFLKNTNEIIGFISVGFDPSEEGTFHVSYYMMKKYRRSGYIKETFSSLIEVIKKNEIIIYGPWNRVRVLEETKPIIKLLRIEIDENNIASFNMAKALGFSYEGKILKRQRINDEEMYTSEHHLFLKV